MPRKRFHIELIKPSHYDDDGYVIQWWKSGTPSNSLACLHALVKDAGARRVLGDEVDITISGGDECNTIVSLPQIARRVLAADTGLVCMVGVQSNQFPRAMDMARELRRSGIAVVIGGFHVSGCLAMLPELPQDLREAVDLGIILYGGEAEGHIDELLRDAHGGALEPVYNFMADLPPLNDQPGPFLPGAMMRRYAPPIGAFDSGRGCPYQCSFCTIINVQGRKSRYRTADDVEALLRSHLEAGIYRFFITDDDFARNRNWEAILDRIIELREREGIYFRFIIQVDALAYKLPRFIEKCERAGCRRVFIGLENINPENLASAGKRQNRVGEYREMLMAWRDAGIMTYCGYILGFPADTVASIERDIRTIQRELPIDILEFFILTPLPGSADHLSLHRTGVPMDPDMNRYDVEHVTTAHPNMTAEAWQDVYARAWELFYTPEHIRTLFRRAMASRIDPIRLMHSIFLFRSIPLIHKVHPLQGGYLRRRDRTSRRPGLPREARTLFYSKRAWQTLSELARTGTLFWQIDRIRREVRRELRGENAKQPYSDQAITLLPVPAASETQPTAS